MSKSPITEANHEAALGVVDRLMFAHVRNPDPDLAAVIDLLAQKVAAYENEVYPFPEPTPAEMLSHLLESSGVSHQKVAQVIGHSIADVSRILKAQRVITLDQADKLGKLFALDPSAFVGGATQQEMAQDWSHCVDAEIEFRKDPENILRHFLQRERQEAREQERARIEQRLKEALRYADEAFRAGDLNDLTKRREMMEELLVEMSRIQDSLLIKPTDR
jgi:HTH-type transcriptional regulator/antitoxin HigA